MKFTSSTNKYTAPLFWLIILSTLVRVICAHFVELGNDEVYYNILSLSPQLSYYDHPPLFPFLVNLTSSGTEISELAIRLSSIIIGVLNTIIIYHIARKPIFGSSSNNLYRSSMLSTSDYRRGFIAAVLYTASIYCSVIVGTFAMPDTPLSFFWLLTILNLSSILPTDSRYSHFSMIFCGITIGLAMLSKYTGAYLWGATLLYIILYNRQLLTKWSLYFSIMISAAIFSPVLIWNMQNDFASFSMQGSRIFTGFEFRPLFLGREILGAIFYNGVINFLVILAALMSYFMGRIHFVSRPVMRFITTFSVPMILLFLVASIFNPTLPHWSAPAYFTLIILAASHLSSISPRSAKFWMTASISTTAVVLIAAVIQINFGLFYTPDSNENNPHLGKEDVTLDMYGWEQLSEKFATVYEQDLASGSIDSSAIIVATKWYEAAHIDSYLSLPLGLSTVTLEDINIDHFFTQLSEERLAGVDTTSIKGYYIVSSKISDNNSRTLSSLGLSEDSTREIIPITRGGKVVENFYIYRLNHRKEKLIIGTSTAKSSNGIYIYDLDATTLKSSEISQVETVNPTFMTFSKDSTVLYAVNENSTKTAGVTAFNFDKSTSTLTTLNSELCEGAYPCHIINGGNWIATANYGGGSISTFRVAENGAISPINQLLEFKKKTDYYKVPHLHCLIPAPDGKTLFANDLGKDSIYRFEISDKQYGNILTRIYPAVSVKRGSGPRHLTFSPDKKRAYLICELSGDVVCYNYNDGNLTEFQTVKCDSIGGKGSADIHISSDGKFLYASNRLKEDGISTFSIDNQDGKLTKIDYTLTGKHPRNFTISPDGNFILVACRDSNAIQIYRRNPETGLLSYTGAQYDIKVNSPMFVNFI